MGLRIDKVTKEFKALKSSFKMIALFSFGNLTIGYTIVAINTKEV